MSLLSAAHGIGSTVFSNLFIRLPYPNADLRGQTIIVTGSNTGLGFESSQHFARLGVGKLIMAVRNLQKGEAARKEILQSSGREENSIEVWELDLNSYTSVKSFAARVAHLRRLDAVLANAGIWATTFDMSEDNEKTITVNVVSNFLLCLLLIPKLRESAENFNITPRFVIVNTAIHYWTPLKELDPDANIFTTLNNPKTADIASRYGVSKLLVIFGVRELVERLQTSKKPLVVVNTPNPSYCKSDLLRELPANFGARVGEKLMARTTEMGSRALVHALLSGRESNGQYMTNCHIQRYAGIPLYKCRKVC
jgi:NAD(P)-dependent dehydrogenase (short-subunit alcohol dehydrogenase family)